MEHAFEKFFEEDIGKAIEYLKYVGCSEIYIFGSLAEGNPHSQSDIDIAVRGIKPEQFFSIYGELLSRVRHEVDLVDLDLQKDFAKALFETGILKRVA